MIKIVHCHVYGVLVSMNANNKHDWSPFKYVHWIEKISTLCRVIVIGVQWVKLTHSFFEFLLASKNMYESFFQTFVTKQD